jgi:hypothetical protein
MMLGRRTPTMLGVAGSARPTLKLLLERVKAKSDLAFFERVTAERLKWDGMLDQQCDPARNNEKVYPQAVARSVSDLAKPDATFVFDTGLNTLWSGNGFAKAGPTVGTAMAQADGIQAIDPTRHSSRNLPLKLSATPFCQGLPGSINAVPMPWATIQDNRALDTNSGPFRCAGRPARRARSPNVTAHRSRAASEFGHPRRSLGLPW